MTPANNGGPGDWIPGRATCGPCLLADAGQPHPCDGGPCTCHRHVAA